jgi:glycosyltransferase involved in cell wall biosynthesis
MPETTVILATYNGEQYIAEFLGSLVAQSYRNFDVVVSDDCSTDNTISVVESFHDKLKILISKNPTNLGPSLNFSRAMEMATGDFIAFADQDDVWQPDKLLLMIDLIKTHSNQQPALVFCDLEIVDEKLDTISASFFTKKKSSACGHIEDFIISNHIPGCAMLINKPLRELGFPVSPIFRMHDWWFAMIAAAFGTITFLDRPLVRYRQHAGNTIGAQEKVQEKTISRLRRLAVASRTIIKKRISILRFQAKTINNNLTAFSDRFCGLLGVRERRILRAFQHKRFVFSRLQILAKAKRGESRLNALLMSFIV